MIELSQVTEFMDDQIVCQTLRQERNLIIKIHITLLRAAAPPTLLIPNTDLIEGKTVVHVEMRHLPFGKHKSRRFVFCVSTTF